jgi:hypothetical protein
MPGLVAISLPDNDKVSIGVHRNFGLLLVAGGACVDQRLSTHCGTGGIVKLEVDIAVSPFALPDDNEVAVSVHRHRALFFVLRGRGVDQRLAARGRGIEHAHPVLLQLTTEGQIRLDRAVAVLQIPIATKMSMSGFVRAGGDIGTGQPAKRRNQNLPVLIRCQITTVEQQIRVGRQGIVPINKLIGVGT